MSGNEHEISHRVLEAQYLTVSESGCSLSRARSWSMVNWEVSPSAIRATIASFGLQIRKKKRWSLKLNSTRARLPHTLFELPEEDVDIEAGLRVQQTNLALREKT